MPIPVLIDVSPGSSPTSGWAKLGPEDDPNPLAFLLDVLFYGALIWLMVYLIQQMRSIRVIQKKEKLFDLFALVLPLAVVVVFLLVGLYLYLPFYNR